MLSKLRNRLTFANVISCIALFVALGGTGAYAANTVFSEDIVDGQVKEVDIGDLAVLNRKLADSAVTSPKVLDNNLTGQDVKGDSLTGADIDEGSLVGGSNSPSGAAGGDLTGSYPNPQLRPDSVGSDELKFSATASDSKTIPPNGGVGEVSVSCPEGSKRLAGGARFEFPSGDISRSSSLGTIRSWHAAGQNNGNLEQKLIVNVDCLAQF